MRYFITLFFVIILTRVSSAQEYIITLNAKEDTTLTKRNFYFDAVEDEREKNQGKRIVGHFGKNDKTTAVLEKDLDAFFLNYLTKVYPKRDTDKALTLRVNNIECSSTGGMLSEAKVKLDIDIVNSATGVMITNLTLEKTHQPLMSGKAFNLLIEEIIASGVKSIKTDKIGAK